ncbi:Stk1 family PASTA domain-containing Ser/Thr kinase [Leucobacter denitrificans]|uniref:non-specific serine/threonine protein kinase n=1 Tax=Leucobacter denitrificans TaxID=683042 RepID=A0A7G9S7N7_9MICO|nr:Stk1 family PASTA domain-containing Ser/Thr kinase [Leucobacter denitrificans]
MLGRTLNERYVIRSRIARGGMAMVYLATDLRLERKVAVKVMHDHLAEDENFTRRFDREARSAARLAHANLVNVFDQGHDLGRTYLVMEYLPNITLRQLLKKQKRLTLDQALEISEAVLGGLAAAHHAGIVHRDLKPENVLLVDDGRIKIGDFGLARAVSANTTTGQALLGTIAYLSPELVTRGIADERSDLYAFGIMLYEMLTGVQPFTGEQPMQIAYQHAHSDVPPPSEHSQVSTPAVDEFVMWLTRRDADLRPIDASEALDRLEPIRDDPYAAIAPLFLREGEEPEEPLAATTVLGNELDDVATTHITPSTAVLDPLQSASIANALPSENDRASGGSTTATSRSTSPVERAQNSGTRRSKRGRWIAGALILLLLIAGGLGYWFGQGPGSKVTIPEISGLTMETATAELEQLDLFVETTVCSSLTVEAGLAAEITPAPGTRVDRNTTTTVCESSGPEMLDVPTIVGLSLEDAVQLITDSRFQFGEVVDTRFSEAEADAVLAALDESDAPLGETFPEQGIINLVVSAGSIPSVFGMSETEATNTLAARELVVDESLNTQVHNDEVPIGAAIAVLPSTDPVRPGDAVGLQLSLGPELFEIPDVSGMGLQEAMDTLSAAGFNPTTLVPDRLREFAEASGTRPGAGERVPKGSDVRVTAQVSL